MWFWLSLLLIGTVALLGISYWLQRSSRRYEEKPLRDVLSEEMQLTLRNERTTNKLKKTEFEEKLRSATEARIKPDQSRSE